MFVRQYSTSNENGGYSDEDWGSGHDRKSVGGFLFLLNRGAISWEVRANIYYPVNYRSRIHGNETSGQGDSVAVRAPGGDRSLEAYSANINTQRIQPGSNCTCSKPRISRSDQPDCYTYHFIRDLITAEKLDPRFCPSSDMIADIMTKSLPAQHLTSIPREWNLRIMHCMEHFVRGPVEFHQGSIPAP